jgi:cyclase
MLKVRLVPVLLLKDGRMIKTRQFGQYRDTGDPMTTVRVFDAQGADELLILDISASLEGRAQWLDVISKSASQCFVPITVGGGIRSVEDARRALAAGADRVSISSLAVENPEMVSVLARVLGSANLVVCVDVKLDPVGRYRVSSHSGERMTDKDPFAWARDMAQRGAGEILFHFVDRDGMMNGYDLAFMTRVKGTLPIPYMVCGGVGTLSHVVEGATEGGAAAVAAGSIFYFTDQSPIKVHAHMRDKGIPVCNA